MPRSSVQFSELSNLSRKITGHLYIIKILENHGFKHIFFLNASGTDFKGSIRISFLLISCFRAAIFSDRSLLVKHNSTVVVCKPT